MAQLDPGANSRRIDQLVDFYGSQVHTDYTRYVVDGAGQFGYILAARLVGRQGLISSTSAPPCRRRSRQCACEDIGVICEYTSPTELNSASTSDRGIPSASALQVPSA